MNDLDRTHYQLLLAMEAYGTISAAAESLFITQSAASQRLRQAQRRLGIALTEKRGRSVTLTAAALRLVEGARRSERLLRSAEIEALWLAHASSPTVTLAAGVHDTLWWLPTLISELDDDPECASIDVVRCPAHEGPRWVADARADIHVSPHEISLEATPETRRPLFDDHLVGIVGPSNPLASKPHLEPTDFHGCHYATYSTTPREGFEFDGFLAPHQAVPDRMARYESVTTVLGIVTDTRHMSILPRFAVPPDAEVVVKPLVPEPAQITWSLSTGILEPDQGRHRTVDMLVDRLTGAHRSLAISGQPPT